eukprot:CAMPEP_0169212106 /NCGR_PEP_ID=MMETSP1016-20121227/16115_1 /TAXON_ID=342587 /ORGANISM="Karlodinium micrum, Strain CCMP2283" /LENGTH=132 /DNA_ID=CAMNT_0009289779 /DNA_START=273 /DNA_END=671 /DNA_ORIENTATION=+
MPHVMSLCFAQPWRTTSNNVVDIVSSVLLGLMAFLFTAIEEGHEYRDSATILMNLTFGVICLVIIGSFPHAVWSKAPKQISKRNDDRKALLDDVFEAAAHAALIGDQDQRRLKEFAASWSDAEEAMQQDLGD